MLVMLLTCRIHLDDVSQMTSSVSMLPSSSSVHLYSLQLVLHLSHRRVCPLAHRRLFVLYSPRDTNCPRNRHLVSSPHLSPICRCHDSEPLNTTDAPCCRHTGVTLRLRIFHTPIYICA